MPFRETPRQYRRRDRIKTVASGGVAAAQHRGMLGGVGGAPLTAPHCACERGGRTICRDAEVGSAQEKPNSAHGSGIRGREQRRPRGDRGGPRTWSRSMPNAPNAQQGSPEAAVRDPAVLLPAPSPLVARRCLCRGYPPSSSISPASISPGRPVRPCPPRSVHPVFPDKHINVRHPRWGRRHAADVQPRRPRVRSAYYGFCTSRSNSTSVHGDRTRTLGFEGSAQPTGEPDLAAVLPHRSVW